MEQAGRLAKLCFGAIEIQPGERRLVVAGRPVVLGPRAFDLLVVLAERAGQLVSKDELIDRVWPNLVVEENNLQVQVSALRKVLGTDAIATVPGHGYRLTLTATAAPPEPARARAGNLPRPLSSFVGRERELARVRALRAQSRLVTLTGFGGMGKTRLALEAAAVEAPPDGAWFVDVAPLADGRLLAQAVASVLGVQVSPGISVQDALLRHVADRRLLIVLDGCERLLSDCAGLATQLLRAGTGVSMLATSRSPLRIDGEAILEVLPMTAPADEPVAPHVIGQYEAVRLFRDRARLARPGFELDDANAGAVAAVCRRLDAIPLAIELAAARLRALSVSKLAERLGDRFAMLSRGDPTAAMHHQTLRALIDWSHDLFGDRERALFRRLATFPGTFTLEAAEAVGAGGGIESADVLDLLTDLIEKSMVVADQVGERYRLLDTVREYASVRLEESGERSDAAARHLSYYVAFAETAVRAARGPERKAWLQRFDVEWENFVAAHATCDHDQGAGGHGLHLVSALADYLIEFGKVELGLRLTVEALGRASARGPTIERTRALTNAALLQYLMGRYDDADVFLAEAASIAIECADDHQLATSLRWRGIMAYSQGKHEVARRHLGEALAFARQIDDAENLMAALLALAEVHRIEGKFEAARPLLEEARRVAPFEPVVALINLTAVEICLGSLERARGLLIESLVSAERTGSNIHGQCVVEEAAALAACLGEWRRAAQLWGAAEAYLERLGMQRELVEETYLRPLVERTRKALGDTGFAAAEAAGRALSEEAALSEVRAWLDDPAWNAAATSRPPPAS